MKKIILITGAGSGFGKLMAEELAEQGAIVIATMRNSDARKKDFKPNENIHYYELDINDKAQREEIVKVISNEFNGKLDVLINNAGYGAYGALEDSDDSFIKDQFETNVYSTAIFTRELLPFLQSAKGKVLFFSSIMGIVSMPLSSLYSSSKFAIEGLAQGLRYELAYMGIQVATICPGRHRTNFGNNIKWATDNVESSNYELYYNGLKKMMGSFKTGKEIPASNVSQEVAKIIKRKTIPSRIIIGKDAKALYMLHKILPQEFFMKLTSALYRKGLLK